MCNNKDVSVKYQININFIDSLNINFNPFNPVFAGSVTLHQWQQLAKPNLGGILHPRPGVLTKDFRELEVDFQHVYSLNDLEEDEPDLSQFTAAHGIGNKPVSSL